MKENLLRLLLILFAISSLPAQEWPRFHGPSGSGANPAVKIPVNWKETDYEWKTILPGKGHSSPSLWGNKLFTTCADHEKAIQYFLCYDALSGKKLWEKTHQSTNYKIHRYSSYASGTPAANEKYVVFNWTTKNSDIVLCLDHNGKEVWIQDFGAYDTQHGNGNSPMIHKGIVYYTHCHFGESAAYAIDLASGKVKWKKARNSAKPSHSTPRVRIAKDGEEEIVFTSDAHGVFALDPKDSSVRWESGDDTFKLRCVLSPILAGDFVLGSCGSGGGGNQIVAILPPESKGGQTIEAWRVKKAAPYVPTGVMYNGNLFLVDDKGIATCMDPATNTIHWQDRLDANFFGSPVVAGNHLYIISMSGDVHILEAGKQFKHMDPIPLGETSYSTPAVANNRMYLRTFSQLFCLKGED
jgi:outer membrane protein assembly factor BamB